MFAIHCGLFGSPASRGRSRRVPLCLAAFIMRSAMRLRDGRPQASSRIDPDQKPVQNALGVMVTGLCRLALDVVAYGSAKGNV
jgi:hypothetical protein